MQDLKQRELKMQEKRKDTSFRDFMKEICSWRALPFYKVNGLISRYPKTERIPEIITGKKFVEDRDGLLKYGRDFDETKSFFENFQTLFKSIPLGNNFLLSGCENSDYSDQSLNAKNAYLSYIIANGENILYSMVIKDNSKNVFNCVNIVKSENIYQSFNIVNSYNIFYGKQIENSSNLWFCTNMIGCHNCLFCNNLENSSFYIGNKQYEKEEFLKIKKELLQNKSDFLKNFLNNNIKLVAFISSNTDGEYITNCSNIKNGYYIQSTHDSQNVMLISGGEGCHNLYDTFAATGLPGATNYYGIMGCAGGNNVYNSIIIPLCSNTYYCYGMENCDHCLGCIGLVNKSFCILNKQYSKEEWFKLANKIFEKMDKEGTLGQFFPGRINPFYFNDTIAYFSDNSFTKEELEKEGYLRRNEEVKVDIPTGAEVIGVKDLNKYQGYNEKGERTINPEILKKVIKDEKGNIYRIVKMEYDFLVKNDLPLPEIHRLDRIKLGFKFK